MQPQRAPAGRCEHTVEGWLSAAVRSWPPWQLASWWVVKRALSKQCIFSSNDGAHWHGVWASRLLDCCGVLPLMRMRPVANIVQASGRTTSGTARAAVILPTETSTKVGGWVAVFSAVLGRQLQAPTQHSWRFCRLQFGLWADWLARWAAVLLRCCCTPCVACS